MNPLMTPTLDREALLRAASILDMLAIGWEPGPAELDTARKTECRAILQDSPERPYRFVGALYPLQIDHPVIVAPVIAIDPQTRWARIWDEWVVIERMHERARWFAPAQITQAGAAWILAQLRALSTP